MEFKLIQRLLLVIAVVICTSCSMTMEVLKSEGVVNEVIKNQNGTFIGIEFDNSQRLGTKQLWFRAPSDTIKVGQKINLK